MKLKQLGSIIFVAFIMLKVHGQIIVNSIGNGSFEDFADCNNNALNDVKFWSAIDSLSYGASVFSYCNGAVPTNFNIGYQCPLTGKTFVGSTFYWPSALSSERAYIKNRLLKTLVGSQSYCVRFYVNIMNTTTYGNDGFGIYFGNNSIDTIKKCHTPLTYLNPQVRNATGMPIVDTLGWVPVSGTFVAQGNEKYAIIGIFAPNNQLTTPTVNPAWLPAVFTDACIEDVSCVPIDLPADAGPDKPFNSGDSVFIGRTPDIGVDYACQWYKMPNMSVPIATVAGLWVKPVTTTTYVVRQQLWCSGIKWDTVVNYKDQVGIEKIREIESELKIFPNPADDLLEIVLPQSAGEMKVISVYFINSLGEKCLSANSTWEDQFKISIEDLPPGVYVVNCTVSNGYEMRKTISVQR
jgi:hypothetical protein